MNFVLVFGINYYFESDFVPKFVQHRLRFLTNKFGFDLDTGPAPAWARHNANFLLKKWGFLDLP